MKRKLTIALAVAALTITGTLAIAQQHHMMMHGRPAAAGEPSPADHLQFVANFLGLNDAQKSVAAAATQDFEATAKSLHEKQHALDKQLHDLLASGTNDANAVGTLVLQKRAIDDQIKAAHETCEQKIMASLNAEQKVKAEALHAAMQMFHQGPPPPPAAAR